MTQHELDQAVADITGESLPLIRRHGFGLLRPEIPADDQHTPLWAQLLADELLHNHLAAWEPLHIFAADTGQAIV